MKKLQFIITGLFAMGLMTAMSCNNSQKDTTGEDVEALPDPTEGGDAERYNINAPDEQVIKLDSTAMDSTAVDTAQ